MKSDEGITLVKMAITCLAVTLVIGAAMAIWYLMSRNENQLRSDMERAVTTGTTYRLWDMQDQSITADEDKDPIDKHPLVSTVASILAEYSNTELLYIYCTAHKINEDNTGGFSGCCLFTYPSIVITDTSALPHGDDAIQLNNSDVPITQAVKYLLQYSQYRCHVTISEVGYERNTFLGIVVEVLIPED